MGRVNLLTTDPVSISSESVIQLLEINRPELKNLKFMLPLMTWAWGIRGVEHYKPEYREEGKIFVQITHTHFDSKLLVLFKCLDLLQGETRLKETTQ